MNIKKHLNKIEKVKALGLFAIGFIFGLLAMYFYLQPKLAYQGKSVTDWVATASKNYKDAASYKAQLASKSAALQTLLNAPTPTPAVKYITQPKPAVKCQVMVNAYNHFTVCCDAEGNCTSN